MEVQFKNFRCFRDTGRIPIRPITILVGENSSGKTSFLAGLNHLFGLMEGSYVDLNIAPFELGSFKDIVFQRQGGAGARKFTYKFFSENEAEATWNFRNDNGDTSLIGSSILNAKGEFFSISEDEVKVGLSLKNNVKQNLKLLELEIRKKKPKNIFEVTVKNRNGNSGGHLRNLMGHQNIFDQGRDLPFLLEDWIETLVEKLDDSEAKKA